MATDTGWVERRGGDWRREIEATGRHVMLHALWLDDGEWQWSVALWTDGRPGRWVVIAGSGHRGGLLPDAGVAKAKAEQWVRDFAAGLGEAVGVESQERRRREHTEQRHGARVEELLAWAREAPDEREAVFNIVANGSRSVTDPPTYAQQLNAALHRAEAAEARVAQLEAALAE